jgi:hypothetical protein
VLARLNEEISPRLGLGGDTGIIKSGDGYTFDIFINLII